MRILFSTAIAVFVSFIFFLIIKLWGQSQTHVIYKHPFFPPAQTTPLKFKVLNPVTLQQQNLEETLNSFDGYYFNLAMTEDQQLILINSKYNSEGQIENLPYYKYQSKKLIELQSNKPEDPILFSKVYLNIQNTLKDKIKEKKYIFNLIDNPLQMVTVFSSTIKELGLQSGDQFLVVASYEPPMKMLKEDQPTYLFGSTEPEILKIKSMEGMHLIEAAQLRADVIIHPLKYYKQDFFTPDLVNEMRRRYKKIIIGPNSKSDLPVIEKLNPDGYIID